VRGAYVKVEWRHDLENEPILLMSEIEDGWEVRKVEVYRDGRSERAGAGIESDTCRLSVGPFPDLEEIAADPQFRILPTSREEFQQYWGRARPGEGSASR
jgi:hypothetical protein